MENSSIKPHCMVCGAKLENQLMFSVDFEKSIISDKDISGIAFCESCTEKEIKKEIDRNLENKELIKKYESAMENLTHLISASSKFVENKADSLKVCEAKERELSKEIEELENSIDNSKKELKNKVLELEQLEDKYWEDHNSFERHLFTLEEKTSIANNLLTQLKNECEMLERINVLNDVFKIEDDNEAGLINGLKLGKKTSDSVINRDEVNAALGQIVFLLAYLSMRVELDWDFECNGSFSKVKSKDPSDSKDPFLTLTVPDKEDANFNKAIRILWEICKDINERLQPKENRKDALPHWFTDEKINGTSIAFKGNWDTWTMVNKYLLTNLKFLIEKFSVWEKSLLKF